MSIAELTSAMHQLGNAWEEYRHTNDTRLMELSKKGTADPLHLERLDNISLALDNYKDQVNRLSVSQARPELDRTSQIGAFPEGETAYKKAFRQYLRKGVESGLSDLQTKALSVGTDADGGFLVTNEMSTGIAKIIYASSPLRQLARVETISTDTLDVIEDAGDAAASWTTETGSVSETTSPQVGKHAITTFEMYAQPKATQKLLDDAAIDVEAWVSEKVADRFARMEATAFISGNGTSQPKGILSYAAGTSWGQVEQINSGVSGAITADSLITLFFTLKEAYARNASFLMNRTLVQSVRMLKEATTNQYLWQPGLTAGAPDTLLGVPVHQAADMPVAAANSLSVAVGDFRQAYLIVDRIGLRTLRDPFTEKPFVKFYTTRRVGGEVVNYEAIKLLKLAA